MVSQIYLREKMDELPQLRQSYKAFKKITEEVGGFFRQREHYSIPEQINFLLALYKSFIEVDIFFETDEELREGKSVVITPQGDFTKTQLDIKHLIEEYETAVSIVYFNLTKDDIGEYMEYCKTHSMPKETMIIKRMFDKFLI